MECLSRHTTRTANFTGYSDSGFGSVVEKSSLKYLDNCGRPVFAYHKSKHKKWNFAIWGRFT